MITNMVVCLIKPEVEGDESDAGTPPQELVSVSKNDSLVEVFVPRGSPNSMNTGKHIVIVMDALKVFSKEPLKWTLDHVIRSGFSVTLLGVMPWIPLALSCKIWLDVWASDLGDLSPLTGRHEWRNDQKYQKIREIVELCEQKKVVPYMRVAMGHPLKLVVLEQTTSLHATLVVIDRHLRKNRAFYAKRLPSNVVLMNGDGGVDMLRIQSTIDRGDSSPQESPATLPPTPQVILSEELSELLRHKSMKNLLKMKMMSEDRMRDV